MSIAQTTLGLIQELNIITRLTRHKSDNIIEYKNKYNDKLKRLLRN